MKSSKSIVVIGAGITGLTTALLLMEKGYKNILVVVKYLPGSMCIEYTPPYEGAHWRIMAKNDDILLQTSDTIGYKKFMKLAENEISTCIEITPSFDYYDDDSVPEFTDPWFKDVVQNFKMLKDCLPQEAKVGHSYTTILVNTPVYLKWLEIKFKAFGDNALFPTRGQTVVVKAPHIQKKKKKKKKKKTITHVGKRFLTIFFITGIQGINYVIPRSDGTIVLGGTANKDDFNPFADDAVNKILLEKTIKLCPELVLNNQPSEIVRFAVGLRPTRIGGPCIENEILNNLDTKTFTHAYGHGGFEVQASWGSVEYVIEMTEKRNLPVVSKIARL
ncbi:MAG: hypothetical protein EXX96DRAFT_516544 [Benjaminiella poitrasii]|nr:MAG: hypothetical protein EXX96DRAFT_516544 [Benjaminiella poitrasii]